MPEKDAPPSILMDPPPALVRRSLSDVCAEITENRDTGECWYVKTTEYATGDFDTVACRLAHDQSIRRSGSGGARRQNTAKDDMAVDVLRKSQSRAARLVREKLLMMESDRILTLTYRENQVDIDQAWKDFSAFNRKMKKRYGDRWQYVCVPERQERGAIHFHLAVRGFYLANTVRRFWREVVGEGNIDLTTPEYYKKDRKGRGRKVTVGAKRIAFYLAKYITKAETVDFNKRRYSASSNIRKPIVRVGYCAVGKPIHRTLSKLIEAFSTRSINVRSLFEVDGYFKVVSLST
jgi:hypothetical protein